MSTREKISAMRFSDPTISGATLAAKLGVSRQRVAQILRELGLETRVVKKSAIRLRNRPEYKCWWNMIDRCTNPENKRYRYYGARGISVCDRWTSFRNFYADMGPKPSAQHSIDRIDNNGYYGPSNCRWATTGRRHRSEHGNGF